MDATLAAAVVLWGVTAFTTVVSAIPFLRTGLWCVRIWDLPRIAVSLLALLALGGWLLLGIDGSEMWLGCGTASQLTSGVLGRRAVAYWRRRIVPRMARVVAEGVPHHITQRGNNRQDVFLLTEDRRFYLETLRTRCRDHGVSLLGYGSPGAAP